MGSADWLLCTYTVPDEAHSAKPWQLPGPGPADQPSYLHSGETFPGLPAPHAAAPPSLPHCCEMFVGPSTSPKFCQSCLGKAALEWS
jgi:hypothetical protein